MKRDMILIPVKVTRTLFRRFAYFDAFYHQKHWQRPLVFALLMSAFSIPCFFLHDRKGAILLGSILLAMGLGLPLAYLLSFALSLGRQMKRMDLTGERITYTIQLETGGIHVISGTKTSDYAWDAIHMAYRLSDCDYLYVNPRQAYLLPHGSTESKVLELLQNVLPPEKLKVLRF